MLDSGIAEMWVSAKHANSLSLVPFSPTPNTNRPIGEIWIGTTVNYAFNELGYNEISLLKKWF